MSFLSNVTGILKKPTSVTSGLKSAVFTGTQKVTEAAKTPEVKASLQNLGKTIHKVKRESPKFDPLAGLGAFQPSMIPKSGTPEFQAAQERTVGAIEKAQQNYDAWLNPYVDTIYGFGQGMLGAEKAAGEWIGENVGKPIAGGAMAAGEAITKTVGAPTGEFIRKTGEPITQAMEPVGKAGRTVFKAAADVVGWAINGVQALQTANDSYNKALGDLAGAAQFESFKKSGGNFNDPNYVKFLAVKQATGDRALKSYDQFKLAYKQLEAADQSAFWMKEAEGAEKRIGTLSTVSSAVFNTVGTFVDLLERPFRNTIAPYFFKGMGALAHWSGGEEFTPEYWQDLNDASEYMAGGTFNMAYNFRTGMPPTETATRQEVAQRIAQRKGVPVEEVQAAFEGQNIFGVPLLSILDTSLSYSISIGEAQLAPFLVSSGTAFGGVGGTLAKGMGRVSQGVSSMIYPVGITGWVTDQVLQTGLLGPDKAKSLNELLNTSNDPNLQQNISVISGMAFLNSALGVLGGIKGEAGQWFKNVTQSEMSKAANKAIAEVERDPSVLKTVLNSFKKKYGTDIELLIRPEMGVKAQMTIDDAKQLQRVFDSLSSELKAGLNDLRVRLFYSDEVENWMAGYAMQKAKGLGLNIDTLRTKWGDDVEAMQTLRHEMGHLLERAVSEDPKVSKAWAEVIKDVEFGKKAVTMAGLKGAFEGRDMADAGYMFTNPGEYFAEGLRKFYMAPMALKAEAPKLFEFMKTKVVPEIARAMSMPESVFVKQGVEGMPRGGEKLIPEELKPLYEEAKKYSTAEKFIRMARSVYGKSNYDVAQEFGSVQGGGKDALALKNATVDIDKIYNIKTIKQFENQFADIWKQANGKEFMPRGGGGEEFTDIGKLKSRADVEDYFREGSGKKLNMTFWYDESNVQSGNSFYIKFPDGSNVYFKTPKSFREKVLIPLSEGKAVNMVSYYAVKSGTIYGIESPENLNKVLMRGSDAGRTAKEAGYKVETHGRTYQPSELLKSEGEFMPRMGGEGEPGAPKTEEPPKIGQRQMAIKYLNLTSDQKDTLKNIRLILGLDIYEKTTFAQINELGQMLAVTPDKLLKEVSVKRISAEDVQGLKTVIKNASDFTDGALKELNSGTSLDPEKLRLEIQATEGMKWEAVRKLALGNTETARSLVANKIMTQETMSPVYWMYRAEQLTGGKLTPDQRAAISLLIQNKDQFGLASFMTTLQKPDWAEKAISFWKAGLLTSPMTHERNIFSNTAFAVLESTKNLPAVAVDKLVSMATGKRTISFASLTDYWKGIKKGYGDAMDIMKYGMTEGEAFKGEVKRRTTYDNPVVDKYVNTIFNLLGAEDKVFKGMAYQLDIGRMAGAQALNEGLKGKEFRLRVEELKANPTPEMIKTAEQTSLYATFNRDNLLATAIGGAKRTLKSFVSGLSKKTSLPEGTMRMAMESTMPFTRTPTNVALAAIDYSPAGLIKTVYSAVKGDQKAFVENLGRNLTGTGLITLGHYLAKEGYLKGVYPSGGDDKKEWQNRQYSGGDLLIGNKTYNIMGFSPAGNLLQLGASLYEVQQAEPDILKQLQTVAAQGVKGLTEQTFLLGISRMLSGLTQPEQYAGRWMEGLVSGMVPTIVRQLAESSDAYQRETHGILDSLKYSIPGLRQTLLPKRDILGRQVPTSAASYLGDTSGFLERAITRMFDPTISANVNQSVLFDEYQRLQNAGIEQVWPAVPGKNRTYTKSLNIKGKKVANALKAKVQMDDETYNEFRKVQGEAMMLAQEEAIRSKMYQSMDAETQAKILDDIYTKSVEVGMDAVLPILLEKNPEFKAELNAQAAALGLQLFDVPARKEIDTKGIIKKKYEDYVPAAVTPSLPEEPAINTDFRDKTQDFGTEFMAAWNTGAFLTDPGTALQTLFSEEQLKKVENGTIILRRMRVEESAGVREKGGAGDTDRLDHFVPIELGGDNSSGNLWIVTDAEWKSFTPVENHLGKLLKAGKISESDARALIVALKKGWANREEILALNP